MPNSRLILIEGIPGSGKTTTARFVYDWLRQNGDVPLLFLEGDLDHPVDYESVACLEENEYIQLRSIFPEQVDLLTSYAYLEHGNLFFNYRKMKQEFGEQMPDALFDALARFDVYELPAEKHYRLLVQSWQAFSDRAANGKEVYVFECCFLQNPVTTLIARHNLPKESIHHHILALCECVKALNPILVYLEQSDPQATLNKVRMQRPLEWEEFVTWYLTGQAYGRENRLTGYEGVIDFYTTRQELELELLPTLSMDTIVLPDTRGWQAAYDQLATFIRSTFGPIH